MPPQDRTLTMSDEDRTIAALERQMEQVQSGRVALKAQLVALDQREEEIRARIAYFKASKAAKQAAEQPRVFSDNVDIHDALCLLKCQANSLTEILTQRFPGLVENRDLWLTLAKFKSEFPPLQSEIFEIFSANRHYLNLMFADKEVMVALCGWNFSLYNWIPGGHVLKNDSQILEAAVHVWPQILLKFPPPVQLQNPSIVGHALAHLPLWKKEVAKLYIKFLDYGVWNHQEVVIGWATGGGHVHDRIPRIMLQAKAVLEAFGGSKSPTEFDTTPLSAETRADKNAMLKIVAQNPTRVVFVAPELRGDLDLALAALSHPNGELLAFYILKFLPDGPEILAARYCRFFCQVAGKVRHQLYMRQVFVDVVLGGIRFAKDLESTLATLNQGKETTRAYEEMIAEYAGIPSVGEVEKLRRARKSLTSFGFGWEDAPL